MTEDIAIFEVAGKTYDQLRGEAGRQGRALFGDTPFHYSLDISPDVQTLGGGVVASWTAQVTARVRPQDKASFI